jgi:hypothetical protein
MGKIKVKRGSGVPAGLTAWEIAYDYTNDKFYIGNTSGTPILLANGGGGVESFNGLTGAVTGVTTGTANTFVALQSFSAGISASGGGTLSNGTYNFSAIKMNTVGGDEGGQIDFGLPAGSSLSGNVAFDLYQNKVRIFETSGSNRGVFIDLSGVSAGVGTNLVGGGGGAVSSVSGSGNGISVSPTTGAVVVQNSGVHSFNGSTGAVTGVSTFNGLTGAVTGVTTGTANTFGPLQSFTNGISSAGGTFSGILRATTINSASTVNTGSIAITSNSRGTVDITSGSAGAGAVNITGGPSGVNINGNGGGIYLNENISSGNIIADTAAYTYLGDYSGVISGQYVSIVPSLSNVNFGGMGLNGIAYLTLSNGEYFQNAANGRVDILPTPTGTTAYGIYFDMTSWGYGVAVGTIRSSDGSLNVSGSNIRFDAPLVVANDVNLTLGNSSAYLLRMTSTGNDTLQIGVASGVASYSGAVAIMDYAQMGVANRSPATQHTNPNLYVYRAGAARANDFVRIEHDGTNSNIVSGGTSGILIQPGSGQLGISGGVCGGAYVLNSTGIKAITGTTYTFLAADNGTVITHSNGSSSTLTVPTGLPVGYSVTVIHIGTGGLGFTSASGVTLNSWTSKYSSVGQHATIGLLSYSSNVFNLSGGLT